VNYASFKIFDFFFSLKTFFKLTSGCEDFGSSPQKEANPPKMVFAVSTLLTSASASSFHFWIAGLIPETNGSSFGNVSKPVSIDLTS